MGEKRLLKNHRSAECRSSSASTFVLYHGSCVLPKVLQPPLKTSNKSDIDNDLILILILLITIITTTVITIHSIITIIAIKNSLAVAFIMLLLQLFSEFWQRLPGPAAETSQRHSSDEIAVAKHKPAHTSFTH